MNNNRTSTSSTPNISCQSKNTVVFSADCTASSTDNIANSNGYSASSSPPSSDANGSSGGRMGGWMMKRLKRRLSQTILRPVSSVGFLSFTPNTNSGSITKGDHLGSNVKFLSVVSSNNARRSKSTIALQEDSISELAERLEENGISGENGYPHYESTCSVDNSASSPYDQQSSNHVNVKMRNKNMKNQINNGIYVNGVGYGKDKGHSYNNNGALIEESAASSSSNDGLASSNGYGSERASPSLYGNDEDMDSSNDSAIHVKMRQKGRRWSEQDIQKRLSLPSELRLPWSVIEKLNGHFALDQTLTRKNRRTSLSEIGFGKIESYQKLEKLGEGTYATVYKGRSRLTDTIVAMKEIRLEQEEGAPCTAIREVSLLRDLKHANVVTLHDIIYTDRTLTLIFEYLDGDLKQYMDECAGILSMNNVRIFLYQLLRGLAYCHARRVLHRDLKPQNLLINAKGELKLADFGLARAKSVPTKTYSNEVVTLWYRPPDVLLGSVDYSTHIDMWGVGCILFEMSSGRPFFPGATVEEQLHLIFRSLGTPKPRFHFHLATSHQFLAYRFPNYNPEPLVNQAPRLDLDGLDLLASLLQYEETKRLGALLAIKHKFFSCLPFAVHELPDTESVFSVPGVRLSRDPGRRNNNHRIISTLHAANKNRRQSMLL